jgi:nicotinamidase-related amidase
MEQVRNKTFLSTPAEALERSRSVLVMLDPLNWLRDEYGDDLIQASTPGLWERWERLLTGARQYNVPVIYTQHSYNWEKMTGPWLRHLAATKTFDALRAMPSQHTTSPDPDAFVEPLRPRPDEAVFLKRYHDAFQDTGLAEQLRSQNLETIVLTGLGTESGIWGTARRGAAEGFYVVVVNDCVSGHPQLHADALTHLRSHFDVVPAEEVLAVWNAPTGQ